MSLTVRLGPALVALLQRSTIPATGRLLTMGIALPTATVPIHRRRTTAIAAILRHVPTALRLHGVIQLPVPIPLLPRPIAPAAVVTTAVVEVAALTAAAAVEAHTVVAVEVRTAAITEQFPNQSPGPLQLDRSGPSSFSSSSRYCLLSSAVHLSRTCCGSHNTFPCSVLQLVMSGFQVHFPIQPGMFPC